MASVPGILQTSTFGAASASTKRRCEAATACCRCTSEPVRYAQACGVHAALLHVHVSGYRCAYSEQPGHWSQSRRDGAMCSARACGPLKAASQSGSARWEQAVLGNDLAGGLRDEERGKGRAGRKRGQIKERRVEEKWTEREEALKSGQV